MKFTIKIGLAAVILGVLLSSLPTLPPYGIGGWTVVMNRYMSYMYSFFNPWTLFACVTLLFTMNLLPFIVKIYRMIMEFLSGVS